MNDEEDVDRLGEELYNRICSQHQENAGKLTGMLLELPSPVLAQLLQDESLLKAAVDKAVKALQEAKEPSHSKTQIKNEDDVSSSSDSLGEQLFELVDLYNTGHSQKITGMLLEQGKDVVVNLLSDQKLLEEQVNRAREALQKQTAAPHGSCDVDDPEELGERLFSLVEQLDHDRANDITGMLLEMDPSALHQLFCDHKMLEAAVQKALSALTERTNERL